MPVPDYQSLMLPLLEALRDGTVLGIREVSEQIARRLKLADTDLALMIPSGTQGLFYNRVGWARTYLHKAGLVEVPARGFVQLSAAGKAVLQQAPARVDVKFLDQFPSFREFRAGKATPTESPDKIGALPTAPILKTPDEQLTEAYAQLRAKVVDDLLQKVGELTPGRFEELVVKVLVAMGYGGNFRDASQRVGRSGDGGIDGIVKEDRLGLDVIYVQAKRWQGTVGRPEIQKFAGALLGQKARKGVFITTSDFSREALEYVASLDAKIVLVDGRQLADFMVDYRVGVSVKETFETFKVDEDFFGDE